MVDVAPPAGHRPDYVDERILTAIGSVMVAYSALEFTCELLIYTLIGEAGDLSIGPLIVPGLPFREKRRILSNLYGSLRGEHDLDDWFRAVEKAERERNLLVHSVWTVEPGSAGEATRMKLSAPYGKGPTWDVMKVTVEGLTDFRRELNRLSAILRKLAKWGAQDD